MSDSDRLARRLAKQLAAMMDMTWPDADPAIDCQTCRFDGKSRCDDLCFINWGRAAAVLSEAYDKFYPEKKHE